MFPNNPQENGLDFRGADLSLAADAERPDDIADPGEAPPDRLRRLRTADPLLSPELTAFMRASVRSVWAVELLVLLRRDANRAWTADALVRELRGSPALVAENLKIFQASGVAQEPEPGRFGYAPASPVIDRLCEELEREYKQRPVTVVHAIATAKESKVQGLADAFRFKRTEE